MNKYERLQVAAAEEAKIPFELIAGSEFEALFARVSERYAQVWDISRMNCAISTSMPQEAVSWREATDLERTYQCLATKYSLPILYLSEPPGGDRPRVLLKLGSIMAAYNLFMETSILQAFFDEDMRFLVVENAYNTTIANGQAAEWLRECENESH